MKPSTFTPKVRRERNFFRFLLPLFAILVGLGASQQAMAQFYNADDITITATPTSGGTAGPTTYVGTQTAAGQTLFDGAVLGGTGAQFDQNTATLRIDAVTANVNSGRPVTSSVLKYRVFLTGATTFPAFTALTLTQDPASTNPSSSIGFANMTANINLLNQSAVLGGGNYTAEIQYESTYTPAFGAPRTFDDPAGATGFRATFSVLAPAVTPPNGTTTWVSTVSTDWTNAANWSNGVPTKFSDAILPAKNSTPTNTSTPALLNTNPSLYEVRTLTMQGTTNSDRALLRIGQTVGSVASGATINIYGDLNVLGGGILGATSGANGVRNSSLNSTIAFGGGQQQVVRGIVDIVDCTISGAGNKLVVNAINASNTFTFLTGTSLPVGLVRTVFEFLDTNTGTSTFSLNTSKTADVNLKSTGFLSGETNSSYIEGITFADRNLFAGQTQTFGNIGVDITPNRTILGPTIQITRTVGVPLSGPTSPTNPRPVKRQYGVSGDVNNAPTVSTLTFHYLDSADELNGNAEPNLTIFRTTNNGIPYAKIGGIVDVAANTVTQTGVTAINTITLGDVNNPLPVTVSSFDAKRAGSDALVSWTTAQEINNKGFNIQVSTNGAEYRTLGFVASTSPNSNSAKSYSYTDTEKNKVGVRYYRLQQIDTDDKTAFFAPRTVSFEGRSTGSGVVAYPNPYTTDLRVSLNASVSGNATARISDMTGRVIGQQVLSLTVGSNDLSIENMSTLKTGVYVLTVSLPSGETKSMRVVKQ